MDITKPVEYLYTQGILGVLLVLMGAAFVWYYIQAEKDKKDLASEVRELNKLVFAQMDLRVDEQKTIGTNATNALKDNSQALYVISEKIETNKAIARSQ